MRRTWIALVSVAAALAFVQVAAAEVETGDTFTNANATGVEYTPNADPDLFLPPAEAEKVKKLKKERDDGRTRVAAAASGCWNLVVNNSNGSWASFWQPYNFATQVYWCGYAYVTYVFRDRWINSGGAWEFLGWTRWTLGGCVGCWNVNVWNQASWKRTRPLATDVRCFPQTYAEGRAGGTYTWSKSDNC